MWLETRESFADQLNAVLKGPPEYAATPIPPSVWFTWVDDGVIGPSGVQIEIGGAP